MDAIKGEVSATVESFWTVLKIYYDQPKSINKQVLFSESVFSIKFNTQLSTDDCHSLYKEFCDALIEEKKLENFKNQELKFINVPVDNAFNDKAGTYVLIRKLIPKLNFTASEFFEILFIDKMQCKVFIFTYHIEKKNCSPEESTVKFMKQDPYIILKFNRIELSYQNSILELCFDKTIGDKGINWLKVIFFNKFSKLLINNNNKKTIKKVNKLVFTEKIDIKQYYQLYEKMKEKYAKNLIENWTENTDAKKFVHEDIGIATYLLMLWNGGTIPEKKAKKQRFVDLGCGNGLLVHILNSEGHLGVGLDIRKRKIWDMYDATTVLKEQVVIPSIDTKYPEADWLIGNHSDELTAWLPIMAKRSNSTCQYFVLPCCPYQLNGQKFQRKNSGMSCYQNFITYVSDISELCGFETYVDKLKIPSTKRICLVGFTQQGIQEDKINKTIINFVERECAKGKSSEESTESIAKDDIINHSVKIRDSVEIVRNCTKLPTSLIEEILKAVMESLLKEKCYCTIIRDDVMCKWNRGKKLSVSQLAETIGGEFLKQLKKECKGLQTLLKNHHFLFEVNQGFVQFRSPESLLEISKKFLNNGDQSKWKNRSCWFYRNHPDKCPLSNEDCSYRHELQ